MQDPVVLNLTKLLANVTLKFLEIWQTFFFFFFFLLKNVSSSHFCTKTINVFENILGTTLNICL